VVPRGFPAVLVTGKLSQLPKQSSGRLEMARWIAADNHPLTARVIVNRLWRWHFGQGLVRSVDNFGRLGEKPSHPELLDWLAQQFIENKGSWKAMHRLIMRSEAYQMQSAIDPVSFEKDPENRYLWRFPVRRLEGEAIRDSLLFVSGILDTTPGEQTIVHVKNREHLFDHTSKDLTTYQSKKRSIYLPVVRNNLYDVFQLFDATDGTVSNGNRDTTTVPTQALFLLNSDLIHEASQKLADRLLRESIPTAERIQLLYRLALGRAPTAKEQERFQRGLTQSLIDLESSNLSTRERTQKAWGSMCQLILASNEFVYVE
jgi:Protein of unknown function (DUF1553)